MLNQTPRNNNPLIGLKAMVDTKKEQQELRELIEECRTMLTESRSVTTSSELILAKLKRTLNGFLLVGIPIVATFFGSYLYNSNRMTKIEATRMTDEVLYEKFATKQKVVYLQNDIYDINNAAYESSPFGSADDIEKQYTKALKEFMGDVSRGM